MSPEGYVAAIALVAWVLFSKRSSTPQKVNLPYVDFDDDDKSAERWRRNYESVLKKGYEEVSSDHGCLYLELGPTILPEQRCSIYPRACHFQCVIQTTLIDR